MPVDVVEPLNRQQPLLLDYGSKPKEPDRLSSSDRLMARWLFVAGLILGAVTAAINYMSLLAESSPSPLTVPLFSISALLLLSSLLAFVGSLLVKD